MNTGQARIGLSWDIKYAEIMVITMLVMAFLTNIQLLVLAAFGIACILILFSKEEETIDYLAFFTSFAGIFVYQGKHMYFVMVALFVIRFLISNRVPTSVFSFYVILVVYCFVFCDFENRISFVNLIGLILLFAIPIIAVQSKQIDCRKMMQHYIFGFVISTVIGFFVDRIPSMAALFDYDLMWTEDYVELTRFCGLAFDSNFYALSNYIIIAYLLLAFKKLDRVRMLVIIFLIIAGLQTVSKSYFLVLGSLLICYLLKTAPNIKQFFISIFALVVGGTVFLYVSNRIGYNVIDLVTDRFVEGGSIADNTTGRTDIWNTYFELFRAASAKDLMFGHGFNAVVTRAAHNTFIEFMFHYGVIGCILWLIYFSFCGRMFFNNTKTFMHKSPLVILCLLIGIFFLSAYTYEAFWFGLVVSFLTLGSSGQGKVAIRYV